MKTILLVVALSCLETFSCLGDHMTIGYTVFRTVDAKLVTSTNGAVAPITSKIPGATIAEGYMDEGSTVYMKTQDFQIRMRIWRSASDAPDANE